MISLIEKSHLMAGCSRLTVILQLAIKLHARHCLVASNLELIVSSSMVCWCFWRM